LERRGYLGANQELQISGENQQKQKKKGKKAKGTPSIELSPESDLTAVRGESKSRKGGGETVSARKTLANTGGNRARVRQSCEIVKSKVMSRTRAGKLAGGLLSIFL